MSGAVERVRPKMTTVCAIMAGLLPIMWSHGTGAEVMQRIAVPMIGGMDVVDVAQSDRDPCHLRGNQRSSDPIAAVGGVTTAHVNLLLKAKVALQPQRSSPHAIATG